MISNLPDKALRMIDEFGGSVELFNIIFEAEPGKFDVKKPRTMYFSY